MEYSLLDGINSPSDLKKLDKNQITVLASEIRQFLIESVEERGGHLASNLGVVELTLAIHSVFDSPKDHIIFDVGHQCYIHKILTGRKDRFSELRKPGGLSGFTSMRESDHDAFGAGHSSTSISAAIGYAESEILSGRKSHTVCITGDGACTGGICAMFNSMLNLPSDGLVSGALNLDIDRKEFSNEDGASMFASILASYLNRGGLHAQVSSADIETLKDAMVNPHLHRDLRVRVTGYSGIFVDFCEKLQKDVIERFG